VRHSARGFGETRDQMGVQPAGLAQPRHQRTGLPAVKEDPDQIRASSNAPDGLQVPAPELGTTRRAGPDDRRRSTAAGGVRRIAAQKRQMLGEWAAVAEAGGTAVAGAMATDAWQATRSGVVGLFGRRGPAGQAAIEARLDANAALVSQTEDADEVRQGLAATWRLELGALLRQHPKAESQLRTLVVRVWEALPTPQQRWVRINIARNQATEDTAQHSVLRAGEQPHYRGEEIHPGARSGGRRATGGHATAVVSAEEIAWLVAHLCAVVAASPAAWAGRGMTLLQLTALHVIGAQAPVTLTDVAKALGTGLPATSAMVDRLIRTGLVCSAPDPQDRRRIQLTITARAKPTIGEINPNTARRLQAALQHMGPQAHGYLIDVLRETVQRSGEQSKERPSRQ